MSDRDDANRDVVLCARCNKPTRSSRTGTITQWIAACDCELSSVDLSDTPQVDICADCGKRKGAGRAGSLTQWIFRTDCCNCGTTAKERPLAQRVMASRALTSTALPTDQSDFPPGTVISQERYKPIKLLGNGASGTVYLCRDTTLDRKVALKKLHVASASTVIDFQQEAQTCSRLKHPNIVSVLDLATDDDGVPFMVMEYVDGITLESHIKEAGVLQLRQAVNVALDVCDALAYAHQLGVLHRDIKSSNILLTSEHAYLIDFGIARFKEEYQRETVGMSTTGNTIAGSPCYMSPDQVSGRSYDERSEIYSLGCVIFESLAGRPPFVADSALETLSLQAHSQPPRLSDIVSGTQFPESIETVIDKCLAKDPDERFQTMRELRAALLDVELPTRGFRAQEIERSTVFMAAKSFVQEEKKLRIAIASGLVLAIAIGGISFRLWQNEKNYQPLPKTEALRQGKRIDDITQANRRQIIVSSLRQRNANLELASGFIRDEDLKLLKGYDRIETLDLEGNPITDAGMKYVSAPYLKGLTLTNSNVKTLDFLSQFKNLETLRLEATEIDDNSLKNLRQLPMLRHLRVDETSITDKGILELRNIKSLELVDVRVTAVTPRTLKELSDAMPVTAFEPKQGAMLGPTIVKMYALREQNNIPEAIRCATEIINTVERIQGKEAPFLAKYLLFRSNCEAILGQFTPMKNDVLQAIKIAEASHHDQYLKHGLRTLRGIKQTQGDLPGACATQTEVVKVVRRLEGPDSKDLATELFDQGELLLVVHEPERAIEAFNEYLKSPFAVKTEPRYGWALSGLGLANLVQDRVPQAYEYYKKANAVLATIQLDKKKQYLKVVDVYYGLSRCEELTGQTERAIVNAKKCLELAREHKFSSRVRENERRLEKLIEQSR